MNPLDHTYEGLLMSNDLTTYTTPTLAVATSKGSTSTSQSTERVVWRGTVLSFDDLPKDARKVAPASGVLAERVIALADVGIDRSGVARQTRLAFRAYADRVVTLKVSRVLTKRSDGRYAPLGAWEVREHSELATAIGRRASRQVGKIKPGRLITGSSGDQSHTAEPAREAASAAHAETYLPAGVRGALSRAVPQPFAHVGEIALYGEGRAATQEVVVLRLGGASAVVVKAERPNDPKAAWSVTQWMYALDPRSKALSA